MTDSIYPGFLPADLTGRLVQAAGLLLAFRSPLPDEDLLIEREKDLIEQMPPGIRCPICQWRPTRFSVWTCWDCDYPEYFYEGCGTDWNTFETRGICPTCAHQWVWTSCLQCEGWSKHLEWYENPQDQS